MGNGQGLTLDIETIESAALAAAANHGRPNFIIFNPNMILSSQGWEVRPHFRGTEWANYYKLTKRELAFAHLQIFLMKFNLQKHLEDPDERRADAKLAEKRLKRAKWARYQKAKKVQSSP